MPVQYALFQAQRSVGRTLLWPQTDVADEIGEPRIAA